MYANLNHVSSQTLWSAPTTAPVNFATVGNGGHNVFTAANSIASDASNMIPGTYLFTINNPGGAANVCLIEIWLKLVTGGTCTANSQWRMSLFGQPVRAASLATNEFYALGHPITEATQALASTTLGYSGAVGALAGYSSSGVLQDALGSLNNIDIMNGALIGNRTTAAGERAHAIIPVGLMNNSGIPYISGLEKLYMSLKTVNAAAITATTPSVCGIIAAHLYEVS